MRNYPETIERLMREISDMNQNIQRERERMDLIEADTHIEIATMKNDDGKPIYSNDVLRKAAFTKAVLANAEYTVISQSLETLEKQRLYHLAHVERLKMEFKLYLFDREQVIAAGK